MIFSINHRDSVWLWQDLHDLVIGGDVFRKVLMFRMSAGDEQDFIKDYLTEVKGFDLDKESLIVYNFGYNRPLPFPSISLTPDSKLSINLQTSGMHAQSRRSIAVVGEKYVGRFEEIMLVIELRPRYITYFY